MRREKSGDGGRGGGEKTKLLPLLPSTLELWKKKKNLAAAAAYYGGGG